MRPDSIAFAISGMLFGVIVGWILGTQQAARRRPCGPSPRPPRPRRPRPAAEGRPPAPPSTRPASGNSPTRPPATRPIPRRGCSSATSTSTPSAIPTRCSGTRRRCKLQPNDANVSTDLGVAYYYTDQPDKAIAQFEQSLRLDAKHTKTMLNMGIVKAFGKQDLAGASAAWQQVIATAPDSPEAQAARKALEGLAAGASRRRAAFGRIRKLIRVSALLPHRHGGALCPAGPGPLDGRRRRKARRGRASSRHAAWRRAGEDGPRPGVRHVRRPRQGLEHDGRRRDHVVLLRALPHRVRAAAMTAMFPAEDQTRPTSSKWAAGSGCRASWRRTTATSASGCRPDRLLTTPKNVSKGFMTPDMMVVTDPAGRQGAAAIARPRPS